MSNRTKNEICLGIWQHYKELKAHAVSARDNITAGTIFVLNIFREAFKHEIYLGAKVEQKEAFNDAAMNVFTLNMLQSQILHKKGRVVVKQRLRFNEGLEQIQRPAGSVMVLDARWMQDHSISVMKSDGETDFIVTADNPFPDIQDATILWIAEPWVPTGESQGKAWYEMTPEERAKANTAGVLRAASTFPKYLQRRRAEVENIEVCNDDREVWLEYILVVAPGFDRQTFEEDALKVELGIEGATEDDDTTPEETMAAPAPAAAHEQGVDTSAMGEELLEELERSKDENPEHDQLAPEEAF